MGSPRRTLVVAVAFATCTALAGCDGATLGDDAPPSATTTSAPSITTTTTTTVPPPPTTTTTTEPLFTLQGSVHNPAGAGLSGAAVSAGGRSAVTNEDGLFSIEGMAAGTVEISRPGWETTTIDWPGDGPPVTVTLQPRIVRAIRAVYSWVEDDDAFATLLGLASESVVNTLVFDTKDESGRVHYATTVAEATDIGAVDAAYDPVARVSAARDAGLYTITRIAVFEDPIRAKARPEAKLAGTWINMTDSANWEYPLALATEACDLGFDEIQFDYVRFPAGRTAEVARQRLPTTQDERIAAIVGFLAEARNRLAPAGCAFSADIFAIVLSSPDDQGIGQRPEELSAVVDALSPMIYPSHYSDGWLGFPSPNDHPGAVTADALDAGIPRMAAAGIMRPWLQAFGYSAAQILAGIEAAEARGVGWILWNAGGNYSAASLPTAEPAGD